MLRLLCLATALLATTAGSDQRFVIYTSSDVRSVAIGGSKSFSYFAVDGERLFLTTLLNDEHGGLMHARVGLADGQHHTLTLADDDDLPGPSFTYHRIGQTIIVTAREAWFSQSRDRQGSTVD